MITQNYYSNNPEGEVEHLIGTTPFLPPKVKTGGKVNYIWNKEAMVFTERQTDHVYKTIEEGKIINTKTVTCESVTC